MIVAARRLVILLPLCLLFCSCGEEGPPREETYPVTGEVYVDGQPASGLQVTCHGVEALETGTGWVCKGTTSEEGKFEINTYEMGDGVPEGEYVLTFMWGKFNAASRRYAGPDKLNDRYSDPKTSEHRFTVEAGKPTDLGRFELTTK